MVLQLDKLAVGVLIFGLVVFAGVALMTNTKENYSGYIESGDWSEAKLGGIANKTTNTTDMEAMEQFVLGGNTSSADTANDMLSGGFSALRLMKNSASLMREMFVSVQQELGVPTIFITIGVACIAIMIVFAIIYMIFRMI